MQQLQFQTATKYAAVLNKCDDHYICRKLPCLGILQWYYFVLFNSPDGSLDINTTNLRYEQARARYKQISYIVYPGLLMCTSPVTGSFIPGVRQCHYYYIYRRPNYNTDRDAALRDWILAELHNHNARRLAVHSTNVLWNWTYHSRTSRHSRILLKQDVSGAKIHITTAGFLTRWRCFYQILVYSCECTTNGPFKQCPLRLGTNARLGINAKCTRLGPRQQLANVGNYCPRHLVARVVSIAVGFPLHHGMSTYAIIGVNHYLKHASSQFLITMNNHFTMWLAPSFAKLRTYVFSNTMQNSNICPLIYIRSPPWAIGPIY